jgi:hypothetical protein
MYKKQHLEEFNMGLPKRKNNINVYGTSETYLGKQSMDRRQELLDQITKSDSFLPDSILHDDLDLGMLEFVKKNFVVISDGEQIPVIPKILTVQRWGEFTNNWQFSDEDGNVKLPFISIIRRPDVQPGTHPVTQRTIPDRSTFYYASVPVWNGTQLGADIYKIPQPVAIDISFEVSIVCTKFRDLNKFNKIVLQKFSSRQAYTIVKGHYIPIILETIDDNTPMDTLDGRRFYMQNYKFTMLGFLIDSEEFEIKPAISRTFITTEIAETETFTKQYVNKSINITIVSFTGDGVQTVFSVGESINVLFGVTINGLLQERDIDYYHVSNTSRITFVTPPYVNSIVTIKYYKGKKNNYLINSFGNPVYLANQYFVYNGSSLSFHVNNPISDVISFDINGLPQEEGSDYNITGTNEVSLTSAPVLGSKIGVTYLY